jgi:hypothetical protein
MSNDRVTTYSADEVTLSFAGVPIDSGYSDGEFVSVEQSADDFSDKSGADGETARAKNLDKRATIKIKLMQTSLGNTALTQLRALALAGTNGADIGTFLLKDRSSGVTVARADKAWISKPPAPSRGREIVDYEWTLRAAKVELDLSGNPSI